ncbi:hypothetical protein SAMN05444166_1093 [Singulisphaera sp. GP187]|nr:hypothetical protein SAMN05444166_1093 [Singulisphaera sp. GP187]
MRASLFSGSQEWEDGSRSSPWLQRRARAAAAGREGGVGGVADGGGHAGVADARGVTAAVNLKGSGSDIAISDLGEWYEDKDSVQ